MLLIEAIIAVFLLVSLGGAGLGLAGHFAPEARRSRYWSLALLGAAATAIATFELLLAAYSFRIEAAVALAATGWLLARQRGLLPVVARKVEREARSLRLIPRILPGPERLALGILGSFVFLYAGRSVFMPPLAWDSLTFHLWRAGRWVQDGADIRPPAPDSWGYYDAYPTGGDSFWAWAMLPFQTDVAVGLLSVTTLLAIAPSAYRLARAVGTPRGVATILACAATLLPVHVHAATAAYVDNMVVSAWLFAVAELIGTARKDAGLHRSGNAAIALLAAAIAANAKPTGLPLFVVAGAMFTYCTVRERKLAPASIAILLSLVPIFGGYIRNAILHHNPLFPFALGPLVGELENTLLMSLAPVGREEAWLGQRLFPAWLWKSQPRAQFQAFGPIFFVGLMVACWRLRRQPWTAALLALLAAPTLTSLFGPTLLAQRTLWVAVSARLVSAPLTAIAVCAGMGLALSKRGKWSLLAISMGPSLLFLFPSGLSTPDARWLPAGIAVLLVAGVIVVGSARRWGVWGGLAASAGVLALSLALATWFRPDARRDYYAAVADLERHPYDGHSLSYVDGLPAVWARNDTDEPLTIAFAPAWRPPGQAWFKYPLLGSRLQNTVIYVPPTLDGSIVPLYRRDLLALAADRTQWLRRLCLAQVHRVVSAGPEPAEVRTPEITWILQDPERFRLLDAPAQTVTFAYRPGPGDCEGQATPLSAPRTDLPLPTTPGLPVKEQP